jgi:hypothetical protein
MQPYAMYRCIDDAPHGKRQDREYDLYPVVLKFRSFGQSHLAPSVLKLWTYRSSHFEA